MLSRDAHKLRVRTRRGRRASRPFPFPEDMIPGPNCDGFWLAEEYMDGGAALDEGTGI